MPDAGLACHLVGTGNQDKVTVHPKSSSFCTPVRSEDPESSQRAEEHRDGGREVGNRKFRRSFSEPGQDLPGDGNSL